ncbi:hypothetical protein HGRIS_000242 [Hohenbuehelia grisea]|uniref:Uncharacterized protein n=1 Tax=Hohenbuehelia grisea TaxID=104357 RepID=A0ABR3JSD4_9AGAR
MKGFDNLEDYGHWRSGMEVAESGLDGLVKLLVVVEEAQGELEEVFNWFSSVAHLTTLQGPPRFEAYIPAEMLRREMMIFQRRCLEDARGEREQASLSLRFGG